MGKQYKINKYTKSILEGFGYEIVLDDENESEDHFQGVITLRDKKTGIALPGERCYLVDLDEDEWLSGMYDFCEGTPTDIYQGHDERIELTAYGDTDIYLRYSQDKYYLSKLPQIHINNHNEDSKTKRIIIKDSNGKGIQIIHHCDTDFPPRNSITIQPLDSNKDIVYMHSSDTEWIVQSQKFEISACTPEVVVPLIIKKIEKYNNGEYWNSDIKECLEVIAPALGVIVYDFRKGWINEINSIIAQEHKSQKEARKNIDSLIGTIEASAGKIALLSEAEKELSRGTPKQLRKRENEVRKGGHQSGNKD